MFQCMLSRTVTQQKAGVPHSLTTVQEFWEEEMVVSHPLKRILKPEIRTDFPLRVFSSYSVASLYVSANPN